MSSDRERLEHMLEAIEQIRKYSVQGRKAFETSELIQSWMVRHLQIIGEAATKLSPELKKEHPQIPWKEVIGMRHILVHDYFEIDIDKVWKVIEVETDRLKTLIEKIFDSMALK